MLVKKKKQDHENNTDEENGIKPSGRVVSVVGLGAGSALASEFKSSPSC